MLDSGQAAPPAPLLRSGVQALPLAWGSFEDHASGLGLVTKIKSDTVSTISPSICHEVMGPDAMIFVS